MFKIYDLSVPVEDCASEGVPPKIDYKTHDMTLPLLDWTMGATKEDMPDGTAWADETVTMGTSHTGTHVDAPWHYGPMCEGKKARTIDEMPMEWFFHDGVVLDVRHVPAGNGVSVDDLKAALKKINYKIKPWDIALIQTGADKNWGKDIEYWLSSGMTAESTLWLIEQGCRVMGTDAYGWDRPFGVIKEEFQRTHDKSIIWGAHKVGIKKEYCHIEKLANLDKLPKPFGFKVACFPIRMKGASAGMVRVAAIFDS